MRQKMCKAKLALEPLEDRACPSTIAYWRFEEGKVDNRANGQLSILDDSGNGLNGTPQNGPLYRADVDDNPIPQTGDANELSIQFSGTKNQRIFVTDNDKFELTQSLTIEAHIQRTGPQSWLGQILFRGDDRFSFDPYYLAMSGNDIYFHVENALGQQANLSASLSTLNQWFHVAGTLDDATGAMRLYIDGTQVAGTTTTVRPFAKLDLTQKPGLGIGSLQADTICCQYFHGYIDELRLSDQALRRSQFLNAPKFVPPPDSTETPITFTPMAQFVDQSAAVTPLDLHDMPASTLGQPIPTDATIPAGKPAFQRSSRLATNEVQLDITPDPDACESAGVVKWTSDL